MRVLIYGCGYLGVRAARQWLAAGSEVWAVTRSSERARQLAGEGIRPITLDLVQPPEGWRSPEVDTTLYSVGFDRSGGRSIDEVYAGGLAAALAAAPQDDPSRWIYVSTTGVYGGGEGQVIDEQSPCEPQRPGGLASLRAEAILRESRADAWILRMAGLYGPGRIPRAANLRSGEPIEAHPEAVLNLVHVEDAAAVIVAASRTPAHGCEVLNVSDGHPVQRGDFYREAAAVLGCEPPQFQTPPRNVSPRGGPGGKRIDNARLIERLRPEFRYRSYREGLPASLLSIG